MDDVRDVVKELDQQFNGMTHAAHQLLKIITAIIELCLSRSENKSLNQFKLELLDLIQRELPSVLGSREKR